MEKMTNLIAMNYVIDNCELPEDVLEKMCNMRDSLVKKAQVVQRLQKPMQN